MISICYRDDEQRLPHAFVEPALQWAFAGTAVHEVSEGKNVGRWVHEVDSKHPSGFTDSGTFTDLPNGDALEEGITLDDSRSSPTERAYEEVWRDTEVEPDVFYYVMRFEGSRADGTSTTAGYFFVLGKFAQGILKDRKGMLGVVRWTFQDDQNAWVVDFRSGELADWFPDPKILSPKFLKGESILVDVDTYTWRCIESGGRL